MNFIEHFKKGQAGKNIGLAMGKGLKNVSDAVNGVLRQMIYAVGAGPKVGKSTMVDVGFVIEPYLDALEKRIPLDIIYFSYEIDRVSKEFDFMAHFLFRDFSVEKIVLPDGVTIDGKNEIELSSTYLRGRAQDDNGNPVLVNENIKKMIIICYKRRIIPLFGEYDSNGKQLKEGVIKFYPQRETPTGVRNILMAYAEKQGKFIYSEYKDINGSKMKKIIGYKLHNPDKFTIIVTDHLRKLVIEKGFQMKQNVDKYVEYSVELRNWCEFTFVHIIHLNRWTDTQRLKFSDDLLYPTGDDFKDTGNLSEEADYVFTMMNPNDGRYNLTKHFGEIIKDKDNNEFYPDMRTIHLVDSRHVRFPRHFRVNMSGGIKKFEILNLKVVE